MLYGVKWFYMATKTKFSARAVKTNIAILAENAGLFSHAKAFDVIIHRP